MCYTEELKKNKLNAGGRRAVSLSMLTPVHKRGPWSNGRRWPGCHRHSFVETILLDDSGRVQQDNATYCTETYLQEYDQAIT